MRKQEGRINHVMSFGVSLDAIDIHLLLCNTSSSILRIEITQTHQCSSVRTLRLRVSFSSFFLSFLQFEKPEIPSTLLHSFLVHTHLLWMQIFQKINKIK